MRYRRYVGLAVLAFFVGAAAGCRKGGDDEGDGGAPGGDSALGDAAGSGTDSGLADAESGDSSSAEDPFAGINCDTTQDVCEQALCAARTPYQNLLSCRTPPDYCTRALACYRSYLSCVGAIEHTDCLDTEPPQAADAVLTACLSTRDACLAMPAADGGV